MWTSPKTNRAFRALRESGDLDGKAWGFTYPELAMTVNEAAEDLGVALTPYVLRHSGPSWQRLRATGPRQRR